jgi:nitronate monooxygenase
VNLISHQSNGRFQDDLEIIIRHQVPLVITSLGHPGAVVDAVHSYGGMVFHDVIAAGHARKAVSAGVDGIIAVGSGAGGHAGTQNIISLIREIREFWDGILIGGGAIGDGYAIRAVEILGANLAYVGTRFVATQESMAPPEYKQMLVSSGVQDIVYTDRISGVSANFLKPSIERLGIDLAKGMPGAKFSHSADDAKAWKNIWSAGHGVATIHDIPSVAQLVERFVDEYSRACQSLPWKRAVAHNSLSKVPIFS